MGKKNRRHTKEEVNKEVHDSSDENQINQLFENKAFLFGILGIVLIVALFNAFTSLTISSELSNLNSNIANLAAAPSQPTEGTQPTQPTQPSQPSQPSVPDQVDSAVLEGLPYIGDPNAPVTMIEFYDMQCGFCKRHNDETLPLLKENFVETGQLRIVFADFISVGNSVVHEAAHCVRDQLGDEAFFSMKEGIYENQSGLSEDVLVSLSTRIGADETAFFDCLSSGKYSEQVSSTGAYGRSIGISGTPGFLINGELVSGAQPYSVFEQVINSKI